MPTVPCGVQVRGGLYLGTVIIARGSRGWRKGSPGQKPREATQYSELEWTRTSWSRSARPFKRATRSGSYSLGVIFSL